MGLLALCRCFVIDVHCGLIGVVRFCLLLRGVVLCGLLLRCARCVLFLVVSCVLFVVVGCCMLFVVRVLRRLCCCSWVCAFGWYVLFVVDVGVCFLLRDAFDWLRVVACCL